MRHGIVYTALGQGKPSRGQKPLNQSISTIPGYNLRPHAAATGSSSWPVRESAGHGDAVG